MTWSNWRTSLICPRHQLRIEGFDISNISGTFAVASLVSFKNGRPDRANYRRFKIKTVEGQDDFASMAEVVRRRYTRLLSEGKIGATQKTKNDDDGHAVPDELQKVVDETSRKVRRQIPVKNSEMQISNFPDLILIDGGKGQLSMAIGELKKLGLEKISVIGLAKEFEEIYFPGKSEPLRLGLDHPAVKLLQRIRDESHRVANSYNAQLRLKRISESVLDEFPGIGRDGANQGVAEKNSARCDDYNWRRSNKFPKCPASAAKAAEELKKFLQARAV